MKYSVVVIDEASGKIVDIEAYDPRNDEGRNQRVADAATKIASRLGVSAPKITNRGTVVDGKSWGKMDADNLKIGMVEIGFGKWGFPV